jgi:integrase
LYLQIVGNSRSWLLRVNTGGKRQKIGLGSCKHVTLAEARDKARELHKKIKDGIDPVKEREAVKAHATLKAAKAKTFRDCAVEYIAANRSGWKNAKHAQQWTNTLTQYAFPIFGGLPVADIDTGLVLEVLQQPVDTPDGNKTLWNGKTETATRLRGRIESVLQWAKVRGLREGENPADWKLLKYTLPARNKVQKVEHFAALPYAEMGAFMADLRKRDGTGARALEFAILTALRSKPVRYATWDEIDLEARLWTIPAAHMKNEKEHRVPLSDTAIKLLEALPRYVENNLVFPAPMGGVMSDMTLTAVLRRMERDDLTVHGFRSTFRDWSGETTSYPREVIEHAMAHQIKDKAEAAYQRGDLLTKRAGLMEAWAHYCDTIPAVKGKNVVSMRAKASGG